MKKQALNKLQQAQLQDCVKSGATIKVNQAPKSSNKGWRDTPLFVSLIEDSQPKLF